MSSGEFYQLDVGFHQVASVFWLHQVAQRLRKLDLMQLDIC